MVWKILLQIILLSAITSFFIVFVSPHITLNLITGGN